MKFKRNYVDYFIFGRKNSLLLRKLIMKICDDVSQSTLKDFPSPNGINPYFLKGDNYVLKIKPKFHFSKIDIENNEWFELRFNVKLQNKYNKILNEIQSRGLRYQYFIHSIRIVNVKNISDILKTDEFKINKATPSTPLGLLLGNFTFNKKELENMLESKLLQMS